MAPALIPHKLTEAYVRPATMVCPQCASTEGVRICIEMIQAIKGVHGIHIMAYRQEERVSDIVKDSGALEGRVRWHPGMAQRLIH